MNLSQLCQLVCSLRAVMFPWEAVAYCRCSALSWLPYIWHGLCASYLSFLHFLSLLCLTVMEVTCVNTARETPAFVSLFVSIITPTHPRRIPTMGRFICIYSSPASILWVFCHSCDREREKIQVHDGRGGGRMISLTMTVKCVWYQVDFPVSHIQMPFS